MISMDIRILIKMNFYVDCMLLAVDHQQNYSCVMEDKDNKARKFAIKYKGKSCEFIRPNDNREKGRVVGYNIRNGFIIVRTDGTFGWTYFNESEDVLVYKKYKIENHLFYYVHPNNIIINEQNVRKLSGKTSKRK